MITYEQEPGRVLFMLIVNIILNNKYIWVNHNGFLEKSCV